MIWPQMKYKQHLSGICMIWSTTILKLRYQRSDLKLGKTIAMQFLCSMTMLVVKKFNLTCSSILSVLYKFLK